MHSIRRNNHHKYMIINIQHMIIIGKKNEDWFVRGNIEKYNISGYALDLGSDYGRNSIYMAKSGLQTAAVDISKVGLNKIPQNRKLRKICSCVSEIKFQLKFDPYN